MGWLELPNSWKKEIAELRKHENYQESNINTGVTENSITILAVVELC